MSNGNSEIKLREDFDKNAPEVNSNPEATKKVTDDVMKEAKEIYDYAKESAKNYFGGQSKKQFALNAEVMAGVKRELAGIEQDNERLRQERDKEENIHNEEMYKAQTARLREVKEILQQLAELGVEIDSATVKKMLATEVAGSSDVQKLE